MRSGVGLRGSQPMSTLVYITWHGANINFGDLPSYLTQAPWVFPGGGGGGNVRQFGLSLAPISRQETEALMKLNNKNASWISSMKLLKLLEHWQTGGWAGRRAFDTEAISICIASIHSCGIGMRSIPVPDWVLLPLYRTGSGIGVFVRHSGKKYTPHVHTANLR